MFELNLDQRMVPLETFEKFAKFAAKSLKENPDFNVRRSIMQKFIKRVEIGVDSIKIFWNLDKDHYNREIKLNVLAESTLANSAGVGFQKLNNVGSHSLTNGAQDWT